MPRKTRIDAPGALHHIIERKKIFREDTDRVMFLDRASALFSPIRKLTSLPGP